MVVAANRLSVYQEPPLPRDPQARRDHLSDAVMKAVSAAARLLDDGDSAVVLKAVKEILDLEKTRMRHGHNVLGAHPPYLDDLAGELGSVHSGGPPRIPVDDIYDDDDNVLAAAAKDHGAMTVPTFTRAPDVQPERERRAKPVAVETAADAGGEDTDDFQTWLKKRLAERTRLASTSPAATPVPVPVPVPVELPRDRDTFHLLLRE